MHRHAVVLNRRLRSAVRVSVIEAIAPKARVEVAPPAMSDAEAIEGLHHAIASFAATVATQRSALAAEIAQAGVELGIQIAERLLGAEIAANRQRLDQMVLAALGRIQAPRSVTIKANALDIQLLQKQLVKHDAPEHYRELLNFQCDDQSPRGRLKLETDELFLEWDTQRSLAEIRAILLEEIYSETQIP